MVKLDVKSHTYTDNDKNKYKSVSHILDSIEPAFDPDGSIIARVAAREGVTIEEIRKRWDKISDDSLKKGSDIHDALSQHIINKKKSTKWKEVIDAFEKLRFTGTLNSEQILYNKERLIAGTADLTEETKYYTNVYDFKTSKFIEFFSIYGQQMMLPPVDHLAHCNYNRYSLQLSFYAWMLEQQGKKIGKLGIIWITSNLKMFMYPCNYLKLEVEKILETYDIK